MWYTSRFAMIWIIILIMCCFVVVIDGDIASCIDGSFELENDCEKCPSFCKLCTSNDSCTACNDGYFGETCNISCDPSCVNCHRKYGYCTNGCPDGQFGIPNGSSCFKCPINCKLCFSATSCIECKSGFFGTTCNECERGLFGHYCDKACPKKCEKCDKTNGSCKSCKDGYFYQVKTKCTSCSDSCSLCVNKVKCLKCKEVFLGPYKGKCVELCPIGNGTRHFLSDGRQRCGMLNPNDAGTCNNISSFKPYTCLTKIHCVKYSRCVQDNGCPHRKEGDGDKCVSLMVQKCMYDCRPYYNISSDAPAEDVRQSCKEVCSVRTMQEMSNTTNCFHRNDSAFTNNLIFIKPTAAMVCFQDEKTARYHGRQGDDFMIFIILNVAGLNVFGISIIAILCWYNSRQTRSPPVNMSVKQAADNVTVDPGQEGTSASDIELVMSSQTGDNPCIHQDGSSSADSLTSSNVPGVIQGSLPQREYVSLGARPEGMDYDPLLQTDDCIIDKESPEVLGAPVIHDDAQQSSGISVTNETSQRGYVEIDIKEEICEQDYLTPL